MTAARDAVGLLDHSLVRKKTIPFLGCQQETWPKQFSFAANIFDLLVAKAEIANLSRSISNEDGWPRRHSRHSLC